MTVLREIVVCIRSREGSNCAIARGVPRAIAQLQPSRERIKTTISRILKQSLILLYAEKKSQLMIPPWPFASLSARLFSMSVSLRVD